MASRWILGNPNHEMNMIEAALRKAGERIDYATKGGKRVNHHNAYFANIPPLGGVDKIFLVECGFADPIPAGIKVVTIDQHCPGSATAPGYFLHSSATGQGFAFYESLQGYIRLDAADGWVWGQT